MNKQKVLLLHYNSELNKTLSYQSSWIRSLKESNLFNIHEVNIANEGAYSILVTKMKWNRYNAIVLLHSVFSNTNYMSKEITERLSKSKVPVVYFIGNEYKLMDKKMELCDNLNISMLITQSNSQEVIKLYKNRLKCDVCYLPNSGLDSELYKEQIPYNKREIDIGYRSFPSPWYLGHDERVDIVNYFNENRAKFDIKMDLSIDPAKRLDEKAWAGFLNDCKAQIGTEAGGDFFEIDDFTRKKVVEFMQNTPETNFQMIYNRFFANYKESVPLRIMSSRNIEAAGTKTLQILLEGSYNGHFKPDEHYISLRKDYSNISEVMEKFKDNSFCARIIENAYQLVHEEFTYDKLLTKFHKMIISLN